MGEIFGLATIAIIFWILFRKKSDPEAARRLGAAFRSAIDKYASTKSSAKPDFVARGAKYDALAKLKALHESGAISDSEFEVEKSEILRR
jgi:type II secretory pathway pseudopilin PulG